MNREEDLINHLEERMRLSHCWTHGTHEGDVCVPCYNAQAARVEIEAAELRPQVTTESLRARAVEARAGSNGQHA